MPTLEVKITETELLHAAEQLTGEELESFADKVLRLRAGRRAPHLPREEAELLLQINQGLPPETWQQRRLLDKKRQQESLTSDEHAELLTLNDSVEEDNARRIGQLARLAQLRHVTLDEIMKMLEIGPPSHA